MGATHVTVTIRNPAEPERAWEGLFLVDTGATDCLVPRQHLEAIGLKPRGGRTYELADGSELRLDVAVAEVEFMARSSVRRSSSAGTRPSPCSASPRWSRSASKWTR